MASIDSAQSATESPSPPAGAGAMQGNLPISVALVLAVLLLFLVAPLIAGALGVSAWSIIIGTLVVVQLGAIIFYLRRICQNLEKRGDRS